MEQLEQDQVETVQQHLFFLFLSIAVGTVLR